MVFALDFGALTPEINSTRMYTGAGAGPMLAAAIGWEGLAAELRSTALACQGVIDGLAGASWSGPSSLAMVAAATPYLGWIQASAVQAEQAAVQARLAVAAYETAFAATVPPPVIVANRTLLASLIATNFLGQNTAAIAATEAHYAEMWAQDAAAMYGYAATAIPASQLEPFLAPRPVAEAGPAQTTAEPAAGTAGKAMSALMSASPQAAPGVSAAPTAPLDPASVASALNSFTSFITGPLSPISFIPVGGVPYLLGIQSFLLPFSGQNLAGALAAQTGPPAALISAPVTGAARISAGMGDAGVVGKLSVPQGWATTAPTASPVATALSNVARAVPALEGQGNLLSPIAASALAGRAAAAGGGTARSFTVAGTAAGESATTATIIVLPADE